MDERHISVGIIQRTESELFVKTVSIARYENELAQILKFWMRSHRFHQPLTQAQASVFFEYVNITKIRERCLVRDDARQTYLAGTVKQSEAERVLYRFGNDVYGNTFCPVGL